MNDDMDRARCLIGPTCFRCCCCHPPHGVVAAAVHGPAVVAADAGHCQLGAVAAERAALL